MTDLFMFEDLEPTRVYTCFTCLGDGYDYVEPGGHHVCPECEGAGQVPVCCELYPWCEHREAPNDPS